MTMNRRLTAVTALALMACAATAEASQADVDVRFWESRQKRDLEDGICPCNLGGAYLQKARESGNYAYYRQAENAFKKSLSIIPDYRPAMVSLCMAYNSQHRFNESIPIARKLLDELPDASALGVLGDALLETGEVEEAGKLYERLVALAPVPFAYTRMANFQLLKGGNDAALASLKLALETGQTGVPVENLAWCQVQIGAIYFGSGAFDDAQRWYESALKTLPEYHQALDRIAELKAARGEFDAAIVIYKQLIERTPRPDLQQALGDLYQYRGMKKEADEWHQNALTGYKAAAADGNAHYYHHLASFYCDIQGNSEEALKWAKKDFELRHGIYAYDTLAWALYKNGMYSEAAETMAKALALGTRDAHLLFHAATVYSRAGDFAKGREYAQQALAVNPQFEKFHVHR